MEGKKIVIIEDEPDVLSNLKLFLESKGFTVTTAADGVEGLSKVKKESPDLIVLDVMLPKMSGFEVCRLLKFDERYKKIPIIMLTARVQENDIVMGQEVGCNEYIMKPFELANLLDKINEHIG
jgi:DNA-binding response OmpR family regulator